MMGTRVTRFVCQSALALVLALLMPNGQEGPGSIALSPEAMAPPPVEELVALVPPSVLRPAYHLPVVEVPPVPADLLEPAPGAAATVAILSAVAAADKPTCPVELRAIIAGGEQPDDAFAVVHAEGESSVLRPGQTTRTAVGLVKLSAIESGGIVVRHGGTTYRCALAR